MCILYCPHFLSFILSFAFVAFLFLDSPSLTTLSSYLSHSSIRSQLTPSGKLLWTTHDAWLRGIQCRGWVPWSYTSMPFLGFSYHFSDLLLFLLLSRIICSYVFFLLLFWCLPDVGFCWLLEWGVSVVFRILKCSVVFVVSFEWFLNIRKICFFGKFLKQIYAI